MKVLLRQLYIIQNKTKSKVPVVTFTKSGRKAICCLNHKVQEKVLNCLDDIEEGDQDPREILQSDRGHKYHYMNFESEAEAYIVIADLSRHYGDQEDEVEIVDAGLQSNFVTAD